MAQVVEPWRTWKPFPIKFVEWLHGYPDEPSYGSEKEKQNEATHRILGDQFVGKSALVEAICTRQFQNGSTIYDLFGANDNEMLAWANSPMRDRCILMYGDDIRLNCNFETIHINQLDPRKIGDQKIVITSRAFHRKRADDYFYYSALYRLTRKFRERTSYNRVDVVAIREADEFISSSKVTGSSRMQRDSEEEFAKFHNQMYHYGYALVIDQHRDVDVVKKVRGVTTYVYFKNMGDIEIPRPWWPFRYIDPDMLLRRLHEDQFVIKTKHQCLGVGINAMPPWHIKRGTGILEQLNIEAIDTRTGKLMIEESLPTGGKGNEIDEETKSKIVQMKRDGAKQRKISEALGVSEAAISRILRRHSDPDEIVSSIATSSSSSREPESEVQEPAE